MARISQETIEQVKAVSILELAQQLGDHPKRLGKSYQVNCPNQSHTEKTPDTYIDPNRNIFTCFGAGGCGAKGNNSIPYYSWHEFGGYEPGEHFIKSVRGIADLMGIPVKTVDGNIISKGSETYKPREIKRYVELEAQSPEIVDRVYRVFLSLCPIRPHHSQEWLQERKYTKEQIEIMQLRSVPSNQEWIRIYELMHSKGYPFERIPGFAQQFIPEFMEHPFPKALVEQDNERKGIWHYAPSASEGYFIPVRDEYGRIIRLRVRKDKGKPKYVWFSSQHNLEVEEHLLKLRKNGVTSGAPVNVVVPASFMKHWKPGTHITDVFRVDTVLSTEGEHKSYISANKLEIPIWGAPGVGNFKDMIPMIQSWGVKKFIIAYDMDTLQKVDDSVKSAKTQQTLFDTLTIFAKEVIKLGIDVYLWSWNLKDGKGLDDLLLQNKLPLEVNLRTGERKLVNLSELQNR
ncbi:CHC2 zinc finger domain-containing protein [Psychrobacillus sp. FSL H8-0484]|uniref:CHC2 zinc finger domain-containing protein n=1 Tax=Psychrobacillus sp. FSL H8-0484 TaxID=2921390 RepID=UPI0030F67F57